MRRLLQGYWGEFSRHLPKFRGRRALACMSPTEFIQLSRSFAPHGTLYFNHPLILRGRGVASPTKTYQSIASEKIFQANCYPSWKISNSFQFFFSNFKKRASISSDHFQIITDNFFKLIFQVCILFRSCCIHF